jgi:uroporphyrin-III C-methyltransferase
VQTCKVNNVMTKNPTFTGAQSTGGIVCLVGAGPGDPDLLTVKAIKALRRADCIVYDRLIGPAILELANPSARQIFVGKQAGNHTMPQHEINRLLAAQAKAGRYVVRLKGGDPFMFGRGGEEALYLSRLGIPVEVVPGITAAAGCAAQAGIPLTHRGLATGVQFITGHQCEEGDHDLDWRSLADPDTTLVVYMGVGNMPRIADNLLQAGRNFNTPVAAISKGTSPEQTIVSGCLGEIAALIDKESLKPPTIFIIGDVAALADKIPANREPETREAERPRNSKSHLRIVGSLLLAGLLSLATLFAGPAPAGSAPSAERKAALLHQLRHDCGSCHGLTMKGGLGPPLLPAALTTRSDEELTDTILDGVPGTPMPPWRVEVSRDEVRWLVRQLRRGLDN